MQVERRSGKNGRNNEQLLEFRVARNVHVGGQIGPSRLRNLTRMSTTASKATIIADAPKYGYSTMLFGAIARRTLQRGFGGGWLWHKERHKSDATIHGRDATHCERSDHPFTKRSGDMVYTSRLDLIQLGGADAMEGTVHRGRTHAVCIAAQGRGEHDLVVPRVRHLPGYRIQDL